MTELSVPILPAFAATEGRPTTLGVLGGGQLGLMFVQVAQAMGYRTAVLDPDANSPAGLISHHHIMAAFDDAQALATMGRLCDAITTEFENVPAATLRSLASTTPVSPPAGAVAIAQDRVEEKAHFANSAASSGVGPVPYAVLQDQADTATVDASLFPAILKTARMGYDGKGQVSVGRLQDLSAAWAQLHHVPCVLEKRLDLQAEISVVVARGHNGQCVYLPVQSNTHVDGILARTEVFDGNVAPALAARAVQAAQTIAADLSYVGVLCVEFFVVQTNAGLDLVVNEMAPRPHNSGHYSLEACDVSQFALQVRTMAALPLVQPRLHSASVMLNLLGDVWLNTGELRTPDWDQVLALPGTHLHLYGKLEARAARKMGHITITGNTIDEARQVAEQVQAILGLWH
ncbi:5-(carboxyamino)imidazole ribonucleotide synthase [Comamonadaceae bacterium M7527]|nr:5-(carboxyamino)imidazole ribonucleotide synthase [Comamonadaceae bacterium M7527]